MNRKLVCVLASGGADSAALLAETVRSGRTVFPVYIRCGLRWEAAEIHWLRKFLRAVRRPNLRPLTVLSLPTADVYGRHWSLTGRGVPGARSDDRRVLLPGRNVLLLAKASVFCAARGIPTIRLGTLKGNPFPDSTPAFRKTFQRALRLALGAPISIEAPYARLSKRAVLKRAGGAPLHLAFSCIAPRGRRPCGRCNKCAEARRAGLTPETGNANLLSWLK